MKENIIGVVGGAGPYAGLDLLNKICDQTIANGDQEHLTVVNWSQPNQIQDRTEYLIGNVLKNPAYAIAWQVQQLANAGVTVAAIPCNTAHAFPIYGVILQELRAAACQVNFLHMIEETAVHLQTHYPHIQKIGLLATTGTVKAGIYPTCLEKAGYQIILPNSQMQSQRIHPAIYDPIYGIKATGGGSQARQALLTSVIALQEQGAEAIILGCTELPLVITESELDGTPMIDPTLVLARALIREADASKLKPFLKK